MMPMVASKPLAWMLALLLSLSLARAVRDSSLVQRTRASSNELTSEAKFFAGPGATLGRFRLVERLAPSEIPIRAESLLLVDQRKQTRAWPRRLAPMERRYRSSSQVGYVARGSFGQVWKAEDPTSGKQVAIKIFDHVNREGQLCYLSWQNASQGERRLLRQAAAECLLVRFALSQSRHHLSDAAHIMGCLEEHVLENQGTAGVNYMVMPLGGETMRKMLQRNGEVRKKIWNQSQRSTHKSELLRWMSNVSSVVAQVLQGIKYLQRVKPLPIVHHDLKPGNLVVRPTFFVKIIDLGSALQASKRKYRNWQTTVLYTPPESEKFHVPMVEPWHSFDVYSVGIIYLQGICPLIKDSQILKEKDRLHSRSDAVFAIRDLVELHQPHCSMEDPGMEAAALLIAAMLGPAEKRPSPEFLLSDEVLGAYQRKEHQSADGFELDGPEMSQGDITSLFDRSHRIAVRIKCCCDMQNPLAACELKNTHEQSYGSCSTLRSRASCQCMMGGAWRSFWKIGSQKCIV